MSIDERRAKFRQDLIYQGSNRHKQHRKDHEKPLERLGEKLSERYRARRLGPNNHNNQTQERRGRAQPAEGEVESTYRPHSRSVRSRSRPGVSNDVLSLMEVRSNPSHLTEEDDDADSVDSDEDERDIDEIW